MKRYTWGPVFVAVVGMLLPVLNGCKTSDSPAQPSTTAALAGVVVDEALQPVSGATVKAGSQTTTSDSRGYFSFSAATATDGRFVVQASKDGYFTASMGVKPGSTNTRTQIALTELKAAKTFSAGVATTLADSGMKVELPTGLTRSGTAYSGSAKAYMRYVSPRARNLSALMPGGDFVGQAASGTTQALITYGAVQVQLKDNAGQDLELKSGQTATVRFPANGSTLASIPLWHFDEAAGIWKEEGSATLQGNEYVGTVSHFSSWNLDIGTGEGGVKGIIRDCNGNPLSAVKLKIGQKSVYTDEDGSFFASVPAATSFTISTDWPTGNVTSAPLTVSAGAIQEVGSVLPCAPSVYGRLLSCGGSPLQGSVILYSSDNKVVAFAVSGSDGKFVVAGPANEQVRLLAGTESDNTLFADTSFRMPIGAAGSRNLGDIRLCDTASGNDTTNPVGNTGRVAYTLNGDGRSNQVNTVAGYGQAYRVSADNYMVMTAAQSTGGNGSITVQMSFSPAAVGTYILNGDNNNVGALTYTSGNQTTSYFTDATHTLTLQVTEVGPVGGKIRGTFSGTMFKLDPDSPTTVTTVQVTNGSFEIERGQDI